MNRSRSVPTQAIFVARRAVDLKDIKNGYEEHVYGEYIGYMRKFDGLFYSLDQRAIFGSDLKVKKKFPNAIFFGFWLISKTLRSEKTVLVFAYPSAMGISYIIPILLFLKQTNLAKIIIVVHDLYLEQVEAFTEKKVYLKRIPARLLDYIYLHMLGDVISVVSPSYRDYISQLYNIRPIKIHVFSNASFPELIKPNQKFPQVFTVLYAGSLMKGKGVIELVNGIRKLRKKGLNIKLVLLGEAHITVPKEEWIHFAHVPFMKISELYGNTSVCVIPFPKHIHYEHSRPIKLFDYMAAARPVLSLNRVEISQIVNTYKCGMVAQSYDDMFADVEYLYHNPELVKTLGNNGRKAVEYEFNWERIVNKLRDVIEGLLKIT